MIRSESLTVFISGLQCWSQVGRAAVRCLGANPAEEPPEGEPLKPLSLAAEKYLPCTEDQAKYHQRDFREEVQSDRSGRRSSPIDPFESRTTIVETEWIPRQIRFCLEYSFK